MARSFGAAAEAYQAGRPSYPAEAVGWMLEPVGTSPRVADVGAGTGKLTRVVRDLGADVVAVDPDPGMLAALSAELPDVRTFEGTAEHLPFDAGALDAVVLGQAWHWVEPVAGSAEIGRVVRAGGVLGLIWNIRDTDVDWVRRLGEIMHLSNAEIMIDEGGPVVANPFAVVEKRVWRWARPMTRAQLFALARSRSYLITAAPEELTRIEGGLGELFDEIGAVGEQVVDLPYVTSAFRAVRAS